MPPPEEAATTYWLWSNPPQLGMPAIVEVRSWRSGDIDVHTPMNTYIHWEAVGTAAQAHPDPLRLADVYLPTPEEFGRMRVAGAVTEVGRVPETDPQPPPG